MDEHVFEVGDSRYTLAPTFGCNLHRWQWRGAEVLHRPAGFPGPGHDLFDGGNPLLFPAVGRTWDRSTQPATADRYTIAGHDRACTMPCHGIPDAGNWAMARRAEAEDRIHVAYDFALTSSARREHYPFDVAVRLDFTLRSEGPALKATATNNGGHAAPFAFGLHPYFAISAKTAIRVELPCHRRMRLHPELLVPEGDEPLADNVLTYGPGAASDMGYIGTGGGRAIVEDAGLGRRLSIDVSDNVDTWVVYADNGDDFICVEPWTRGGGAYADLATDGWQARARLPVIAPGQLMPVEVALRLQPL